MRAFLICVVLFPIGFPLSQGSASELPDEISIPARYQPASDGFQIVGSTQVFNRPLYGGHEQDDLKNRFYTLAGDSPVVMGTITQTIGGGNNAKCGTLMLGVSQTIGNASLPNKYNAATFGEWFHLCRDNITTFHPGWCEYQIKPLLLTSPEVHATVKVLPLNPADGFLVHLRVESQGRMTFCAGFGGLTDYLGLLTNHGNSRRYFSPDDTLGNTITLVKNRARIEVPRSKMWIGTSFDSEISIGDAALVSEGPGPFLSHGKSMPEHPMVRIAAQLNPGKVLEGYIVVLRDAEEQVLNDWLSHEKPVEDLKQKIDDVRNALIVETPDRMLNLTVPINVIGMESCWNKEVFCHGAVNWHSPYLGWRVCYGPTVLGWHDRVLSHFLTHAHPSRFNIDPQFGDGYVPPDLHGRGFAYNMQEVAVDMLLHNFEWTGDLNSCRETFERLTQIAAFESRMFDPDGNGLYQNYLNTWVSDGHAYNGGECTQATAYNYRINRLLGKIAERLGRDPRPYTELAEKIFDAAQKNLWQSELGTFAEYRDTLGNQLLHPSPELATIYHSIDSGLTDEFQACQMLRFTKTDLRNELTTPRHGRLAWSSNWYPRNFSACGLYPGENIHLALAYFQNGQTDEALDLLRGIVDAHFMGDVPGSVAHNLNGTGMSDGSPDFADTVSMYLRLIVEGLFGIQKHLLDDRIEIAPHFPADWNQASLKTGETSLRFLREGKTDRWEFSSKQTSQCTFRIPLRGTTLESVELNGKDVEYRLEPRIGRCDLIVETTLDQPLTLIVHHGSTSPPRPPEIPPVKLEEQVRLTMDVGQILQVRDPSTSLTNFHVEPRKISGIASGCIGPHTLFLLVKEDSWESWLPVDFTIDPIPQPPLPPPEGTFQPIDLAPFLNSDLTSIHSLDYSSPRPKGIALSASRNGRYLWDDNNLAGARKIRIDDRLFRDCGGVFTTPGGVPFLTPSEGPNVTCVSQWENFPNEITIPLSETGTELALLLIGVTNPMQSRVENGRITVDYLDGSQAFTPLINPINFDDWLVAAVQRENESVQFSDFNHAIVQRIRLDPSKPLKSLTLRGTANEVIIGLLGLSICRE